MLLDFAQDALNFIKENMILLIVIGVAIILLIAISIFGSIKNKADKKKESEENVSDDSAEASDDNRTAPAESESVEEVAQPEEAPEETPEVASDAQEEISSEPAAEESAENEVSEEASAEPEVVEEAEEQPQEAPVEELQAEEKSETAASVEPAAEDSPKGLPGTVEIYKGKNDFYFNFRASNNILIGRSQGYTTKASCKNSAEAVMNMAKIATTHDSTKEENASKYRPAFGKSVFQLYIDREGKYRWRLYAKNQQNILASKGYTTKANAKSAIQSLKKIAANYVLEDLTKQS